jgi:hypothetical protein
MMIPTIAGGGMSTPAWLFPGNGKIMIGLIHD